LIVVMLTSTICASLSFIFVRIHRCRHVKKNTCRQSSKSSCTYHQNGKHIRKWYTWKQKKKFQTILSYANTIGR